MSAAEKVNVPRTVRLYADLYPRCDLDLVSFQPMLSASHHTPGHGTKRVWIEVTLPSEVSLFPEFFGGQEISSVTAKTVIDSKQ